MSLNNIDIDPSSEEISAPQVIHAIWSGKWIIAATTALVCIITILAVIYIPNQYKSEAVLSPVSSDSNGKLSSIAGQFGGLAALAGINLGGSSVNKSELAIEILKSRDFLSKFIEKHDLIVPIMAAESWSEKTAKLNIDSDIYDINTKQWVRPTSHPRGRVPSYYEAVEQFREFMSISEAKGSSFIKLSVEFFSPEIAQEWVTLLIEDINNEIRSRDLQQAKASIKYLTVQIENTKVTELQSVLYQLIEEQTKTIMLAEVQDEYVFTVIDPAIVPELKSKPKRAIICILAFILSLTISSVLVVFRKIYFRRHM